MPGVRLSTSEQDAFAQMHRSVLPGSLVATLGNNYTRRFYKYIDESHQEFALVRHDNGVLVAGCVVSLAPETLGRRLIQATPVLSSALRVAPTIPWLQLAKSRLKPKAKIVLPSYPEILLIFTKPQTQGRGYGRELVLEAETEVARQGYSGLRVKTLAAPANKALGFYERCGFERWGEVSSLGKHLAVFAKSVSPTH